VDTLENEKPRFSYSKFSVLKECPFKFKKLYIEKIPFESNPKLALGLTFSDISEYAGRNLLPKTQFSDEELDDLITKFWIPLQYKESYDSSIPSFQFLKYSTQKEEENTKKDLKSYLKVYFSNYGNEKPFGVEVPFEVEYKDILLVGKIDLIRKVNDKLIIIDNKLGRTEYSLPNSLQLGIYTYAIETLLPRFPIEKLGYYYVRTGLPQYIFSRNFNREDIFKDVDRILNIYNEFKYPIKKNQYCNWCQFRIECERENG
jgi:CRISPR/Cas system-associated exonuclease Cas4 (RecB family)